MRLLRIRLRHFRGVHDREVAVAADGVTVLQGENEVGKTTTIKALDLLVDVPDSSRRTEVRAAAPAGVDAGPEVEAEIATGPYRFVYRKRWLRRPITELTVTAPVREQLTGSDAHARVTAMLDETMDRDLWKALRVEQHTAVGQADLGGRDALTRALDRAAGGTDTADADADDGLVERVETELRRYRTPTGRSTGDLRDAEQRLADAEAEHDRCRVAVEAVEHDVAERDRLDTEIDAVARHRREHQARVAELEDRWSALQSRLREVEAAREHAGAARERATAARGRAQARADLVAEVEESATAVARADARVAEHDRTHAAAHDHRDACHAEHEAARTAVASARDAARAADDALTLARDRAELADLDARLRRVADAESGLHAAQRELDGITVDQATVDHLDTCTRDELQARAARDAGAASLELIVADDAPVPDVSVDGVAVDLQPGRNRRWPVTAPVSMSLPGRLELRVRPGSEGHSLADTARDAADALAEACADAGVADLAAARAELRRADEARRRRDEHRSTLDRELAGRAVADVRVARDRLSARVADARGVVDTSDARSADVDALRTAADDARTRADDASVAVDGAEGRRRAADDAVQTADTEAALLAQRAADERHTHERLTAELAAARGEVPDDALTTSEVEHLTRAREAENAHQSLATALAADDPDSVEAQVVNARGVDERLAREIADVDRARAETTGRLQSAGSQGWHDQLLAAAVELDAARHRHAAVDRRARAAGRLHETLMRHRERVRRAYVAPFRAQVERLGRIVFGPSLELEVDAALRITHRTLDGVTVAFDDLSSGAKEQLALCARLACAALVDPSDGVPVVIDDALGHSDPERLARLGAVFTAATTSGAGQILVLTCTPERYRGVGPATVVQLAPSRPPARALAAAPSDVREEEPDDAMPAAREAARDVGGPLDLPLPETG